MDSRDWTLAPQNAEWDAVPAGGGTVPTLWGARSEDGTLDLKDTRGTYWRNTLVSPNEFHYEFPVIERRAPLQAVVDALLKAAPCTLVRLYATPGARNEYYGEWLLETVVRTRPDRARAVLRRLAVQPAPPQTGCGYRSHNEAVHAAFLATLLPGWRVAHEPETVLDLHTPSVVRGVAQSPQALSRSYTCDFVACKGLARMCIESKPCMDHVTSAALCKARFLRDRSLTRVVFMVGTGEAVEWLDMGPPDSDAAPLHLTTAEFLELVGAPPQELV